MSSLTEKALSASLEKLLRKRPLEKITVKDITDDCGVNRQTFYYHFHDIYDLLKWSFQEASKDYLPKDLTAEDWRESVKKMMAHIFEEKDLVMHAFFSVDKRQLESFIAGMAKPIMMNLAVDRAKGMYIDQEDLQFVVDLYTFGLVGIITEWIENDMSVNQDVTLDRFLFVVEGTMEYSLSKFDKKRV